MISNGNKLVLTPVTTYDTSRSLSVLTAIFPGKPGLAGYIGFKDDERGGDSWSYNTFKAQVKLSPPTIQHPVFYRPDALPVAQPKASKH